MTLRPHAAEYGAALALHACSACSGDYEDPERSALGGNEEEGADDGGEGQDKTPNGVGDGRDSQY